MKKFCIIGIAGFVAKKHLNCIKDINGELIAACDLHDNVGYMDNYFPEALFFKDEKNFFTFVKKNNPDFLIICSPSNLHFKHIKLGLTSNVNIIVEKPPVINENHLKQIYKLEKKYKKKCYCIFQLRLNEKIIKLKKDIEKSNKINEVKIFYTTYRGDWYFKTWKNIKKLSGGLGVNIGIHFFDILIWIFGDLKEIKIKKNTSSRMAGIMKLTKATVKWDLSIEKVKTKNSIKYNFSRYMTVNNKKLDFDKFNALHKKNYDMIVNDKIFHISEFEKTIKLMKYLTS